MQLLVRIGLAGASPQIGRNITLLWLFVILSFFSWSCAQVERMHRFLRWMAQMMCFRPRTVLLEMRTMS